MQLDCRQQGESQILLGMKDWDDGLRGREVISLEEVIYPVKGIKSPKVNVHNVKEEGRGHREGGSRQERCTLAPGCSTGGVRVLSVEPSTLSTHHGGFCIPSWRKEASRETPLAVRTCRSGCSLVLAGIWLLGSFHGAADWCGMKGPSKLTWSNPLQ